MKNFMPVIKTKQFSLRDITVDDYFDYYLIGSSFNNTRYLTWGPFENPAQAKLAIESMYLPRPMLGLPVGYAIVDNKTNEMIGIIEYHTYFYEQNAAELGFLLREDYHNKGIMSRALSIMIDLGFNHLDLDKIIVGHVDINEACKRLISKTKFSYEYTRYCAFTTKDTNELRNITYYSLYKNEYERGC